MWATICQALGRPDWAPSVEDKLGEWCISRLTAGHHVKDVRAIIVLTFWTLWKHRNAIVFDGATPSQLQVVTAVDREGRHWRQAGILKGGLDSFDMLAEWVYLRE